MEDRKKKVNTIWERSKCTRKMGNKKSNWTIGKKESKWNVGKAVRRDRRERMKIDGPGYQRKREYMKGIF